MKEKESDIKITSVRISKSNYLPSARKKLKRCEDVMKQKADLAVQRIRN